MTNHLDPALLNTILQLLGSEGSQAFAEGLRLLVNEAMVQERAAAPTTPRGNLAKSPEKLD